MNYLPGQDNLQIKVTNFGPIVEADIDLRPLTVFVGPSNTGKSYLAVLIYAMHRHFGGGRWPHPARGFFHPRAVRDQMEEELSSETINALAMMVERLLTSQGERMVEGGTSMPDQVADAVHADFVNSANFHREICRCFGIGAIQGLIRKGSKGGGRISFGGRSSRDSTSFEHALSIRARDTSFSTTLSNEMLKAINVTLADEWTEYFLGSAASQFLTAGTNIGFRVTQARRLIAALGELLLPNFVGPLRVPAFYLPADRTGVMHAHRVVVSSLIGQAPRAGLRPTSNTPMLSGVLADFLQQLVELDRPRYSQFKSGRHIAKRIEEAVLGGAVKFESSDLIDYPSFTYRPEGWKEDLPIMRASSMVSELAPVVLYLRHVVRSNNLLIVEEPESHLHPGMQVEFTRQIASLVQSGVRVLVTTHSEWVLEELSNIVKRFELPETERRKIEGGKFSLDPDQVGAWLFQPKSRPKGSVVKEIRLNDSGLYPSGFDEVSTALHNSWADITSRIGETE